MPRNYHLLLRGHFGVEVAGTLHRDMVIFGVPRPLGDEKEMASRIVRETTKNA